MKNKAINGKRSVYAWFMAKAVTVTWIDTSMFSFKHCIQLEWTEFKLNAAVGYTHKPEFISYILQKRVLDWLGILSWRRLTSLVAIYTLVASDLTDSTKSHLYVCVCHPVQVVVLWVGTNNHAHTAEQVAGGVLSIAELLTSRFPKAKVVVLVSYLLHLCRVKGTLDW